MRSNRTGKGKGKQTPPLTAELLVGAEVRTVIVKKAGIIGVEKQRLQNLEVEAPTNLKEEDTPIGCLSLILHGAAPHLRTTPGRQREIAPVRLPTDAWMIQTPSLPLAPPVCAYLAPILTVVPVTIAATSSSYNPKLCLRTSINFNSDQSHTLAALFLMMVPTPVVLQTLPLVKATAQAVKPTKNGLLDIMELHKLVTTPYPMFSC